MATPAYYSLQTNRTLEKGKHPNLSHDLESYRAYQWEVVIETGVTGDTSKLTLAAKQISQISFGSDTITSRRVNDVFHYPGQISVEPVTITFDNLVQGQVAEQLYDWMSSTYDPITGSFTPQFLRGVGEFKKDIQIYLLDNNQVPVKHIELKAAYPTSWKASEFNYSTNDFHLLEVTLQPDFVLMNAGL
jgi:hypothetical protein